MNHPPPRPPPSDALMQLWSPDGYYTYLGVPKQPTPFTKDDAGTTPSSTSSSSTTTTPVVEYKDLIKKKYRKLSLKHHPDRNGGDAETFRVLNRAQKVLTNPKLKQQYDILGLDLDDEEEDNKIMGSTSTKNNHNGTSSEEEDGEEEDGGESSSNPASQGIVNEMAQMSLTVVMQMGVRTVMMAVVSLLVTRFIWTLVPALMFLAYIAFKIHSVNAGTVEMTSPFIIGTGLILMYQAHDNPGWFLFWIGETIVIAMFTLNSLANMSKTMPLYIAVAVMSGLTALWFRGKFWNYFIVIALELFLAVFIALAFPIMEMVLEAILNDKLKKVGDKVRAHHEHMERYYQSKLQ